MRATMAACGFIFLLILVWIFVSVNSQNGVTPVATIVVSIPNQGKIIGGYDTTSWTNQTIMQFLGIPYAESPKGKLRFKAPIRRTQWRNTLDATKYGRRCPVITSVSKLSADELKQDLEDCLNISVYTKNLKVKQPVMFYIYGGGFYNGSASDHPPKYLLEKDIVLVVPQYRIGALGWLSTLSEEMPGNSPIKDVLLALQWVRSYISVFGGDPDNVTIFGQSAGAAITGALLISPQTPKNIFKRAVIQSGSILAEWAINKQPTDQVKQVCKNLGCENCNKIEDSFTCLKDVEVINLLKVTAEESFAPVVGDLYGVLPQTPDKLIELYSSPIPIMTGFTKDDGSFVLASYYDALKAGIGDLNNVTVRDFSEGIMGMAKDPTRLTNNILTRLLFTTDMLESTDHNEAIPAYFDLSSIQFMKSPVVAFSSHIVRKRLANIYLYSFDYDGMNSRFGYEFGNDHYPFNGGVHHSNDNIYLFSTHILNADDMDMAKKMVEIWTSFALNGVPSLKSGPTLKPMESASGSFFKINKDITISKDVLLEFTAAIDDLEKDKLNRPNIEF